MIVFGDNLRSLRSTDIMNYKKKDRPWPKIGDVVFECFVDTGLDRMKAYEQACKNKRNKGNRYDYRGFSYNRVTGLCQFR
jgi:hypothetical protein